MVTFSDCMTLLLTFFVLMVSFSSFDVRVFRALHGIASEMQHISSRGHDDLDNLLQTNVIQYPEQPQKGSEHPTLNKKKAIMPRQVPPVDYKSKKVFVVESNRLFWAQGTAVRPEGKELLETFGQFIRAAYRPESRLVIAESGGGPADELALNRCCAAVDVLSTSTGLDRQMFSVAPHLLRGGETGRAADERVFEITILEASVY